MSINKAFLIGNVGKDPEIRTTQDGRRIANFSIATSERWTDKKTGERKEKSEWHRIVIFSDGLVNVIEKYVKKGSKIYIEGKIATRKWTDNQGVEKYTTEIVLQGFNASLVLLDGRNNTAQEKHSQAKGNAYQADDFTPDDLDDEIPF